MHPKMKRALLALAAAAFVGVLASCSTWRGVVVNSTQTQVQLSKRNYKVIGRVTGEYAATYVFWVFGPRQQDLITQAWKDMENKAELTDKARTLIHVTVDRKLSYSPFHCRRTVYVSGVVIEFTE